MPDLFRFWALKCSPRAQWDMLEQFQEKVRSGFPISGRQIPRADQRFYEELNRSHHRASI